MPSIPARTLSLVVHPPLGPPYASRCARANGPSAHQKFHWQPRRLQSVLISAINPRSELRSQSQNSLGHTQHSATVRTRGEWASDSRDTLKLPRRCLVFFLLMILGVDDMLLMRTVIPSCREGLAVPPSCSDAPGGVRTQSEIRELVAAAHAAQSPRSQSGRRDGRIVK